MLNNLLQPEIFTKLLAGVFFSVLFLQSGLDKVFNWKGNKDWVISHFSKSPLAKTASLMFVVLTIIEVLAGIVTLIGLILFIVKGSEELLFCGIATSAVSLLMLFFGQRLAQDYPGAQSIAIYFGVALVSMMLFL